MALNTIKSVHGIVLVADLTNKDSFDNIKLQLKDIKENFDNPCLVLFGNKADLKDNWEISSEEAKKYAAENNLIYFETSAKTKQGINEGFAYIANRAYQRAEEIIYRNKNIVLGKDKPKESLSACCTKKKKEKKKKCL